jgi:hypothetical protein
VCSILERAVTTAIKKGGGTIMMVYKVDEEMSGKANLVNRKKWINYLDVFQAKTLTNSQT